MKTASAVYLAKFACSWWLEAPEKSIVTVVCEDRGFRDAMWDQIHHEARLSGRGYTYESIQEWRLEPNGQGVGAVMCLAWKNEFSSDKLKGLHSERQLAILQGDTRWTLAVQEHMLSFPLEALCLVIKKL